jgi:hypothetical protein
VRHHGGQAQDGAQTDAMQGHLIDVTTRPGKYRTIA